jgi:hypothetical protein
VFGGGFAAVMGGGVILEYATGHFLWIDTLFFQPWINIEGNPPGRMAPVSAVNLFMAGVALVHGQFMIWV